MPYYSPPTFVGGSVITDSDMNKYVRDNVAYLFARPLGVSTVDNGANFTTTSTSFVTIGTAFSHTISVSSGRVMLGFFGVLRSDTTTDQLAHFDFEEDGTRMNSSFASGFSVAQRGRVIAEDGVPVNLIFVKQNVSVGSHTYKPLWRCRAAGTITLYSGNGVTDEDFPVHFFAIEV